VSESCQTSYRTFVGVPEGGDLRLPALRIEVAVSPHVAVAGIDHQLPAPRQALSSITELAKKLVKTGDTGCARRRAYVGG
jgi:hypothetical protein